MLAALGRRHEAGGRRIFAGGVSHRCLATPVSRRTRITPSRLREGRALSPGEGLPGRRCDGGRWGAAAGPSPLVPRDPPGGRVLSGRALVICNPWITPSRLGVVGMCRALPARPSRPSRGEGVVGRGGLACRRTRITPCRSREGRALRPGEGLPGRRCDGGRLGAAAGPSPLVPRDPPGGRVFSVGVGEPAGGWVLFAPCYSIVRGNSGHNADVGFRRSSASAR